ncbi:restriction endonuclease subunit S [Litoreibacter albidus]|uniref:restriction endonuclease subunit S n=1 Tax=Litoreibacter albidus TaxID=670155 RepID=UPI000B7D2203|nr:restriction endonuclease subunit S [Litoreibacter albidus]
MKISDIFKVAVARSKSVDDYTSGMVPFVTNTELNNGIVDYVEPFDDDKVFSGPAICISGLGHATVHAKSFLPKGNGGDSCTILSALDELTHTELVYYAALFNVLHKWRFSYGRKASKRRLENLDLSPTHSETSIDLSGEIESNNEMMLALLKSKEAALSEV